MVMPKILLSDSSVQDYDLKHTHHGSNLDDKNTILEDSG